MNDSTANTRSFEMGYTEKEFTKTLFGQFSLHAGYSIQAQGSHAWLLQLPSPEPFAAEVHIKQGEPRQLGLIAFSVLHVDFHFTQASEAQQQTFLKTFLRYFHKGGG